MAPLTLLFSSFVFSLAFGAPVSTGDSNLGRDLLIAQSFRQKIAGPEGITKNWTGGSDVCKLDGFYCEHNPNTGAEAVAGIDLNGFGLYGDHLTLDDFLDKMTDLTFFHANSNNFTGSLPKDLTALKWLYEIDLSSNKLSGPFPRSVLDINLTFLDLRFNEFSGPIPREVFDLDLDVLFLNNNQFSSGIPDNLGSSPVLYLTLANNKLSGSIPKSIGSMKHVQEILLLGNALSGSIPRTWATQNLTLFDASYNRLSGSVPEDLCKLESLEVLNLSDNNLGGSLGPACAALVDKKILDVSNNCIKGAKNQKPADQCRSKE
ncbi:Putative leucine-rich repeat domain superfamily [Colletotrichum destructivum]|uniref:Leucine-rich repeat domain superfamily n=1 Tax=Colletotrichum destructivum TaxID=34406 RepID=A0AAX4IN24_9PEZI|nr:Putative leucine-rich repeat domain superfamily [Colletotrichum destructivum]